MLHFEIEASVSFEDVVERDYVRAVQELQYLNLVIIACPCFGILGKRFLQKAFQCESLLTLGDDFENLCEGPLSNFVEGEYYFL